MSLPSQETLNALTRDLQAACKSVCERYNVDFGSLRGWVSEDGLMLFNMASHAGNIDDFYADLYRQSADKVGLAKEWLYATVRNPDTGRVLQVIGLDTDGGERCVRVESDKKERFNISPSQLTRLMSGL